MTITLRIDRSPSTHIFLNPYTKECLNDYVKYLQDNYNICESAEYIYDHILFPRDKKFGEFGTNFIHIICSERNEDIYHKPHFIHCNSKPPQLEKRKTSNIPNMLDSIQ